MNEKRIREVMDVEQQALDAAAKAIREAEQLPAQAEAEAAALLRDVRTRAQEEARTIVDQAESADEGGKILASTEAEMAKLTALAQANMDRAVAYVLDAVLGKAQA